MFKKAKIFYIKTITPMHVGSGSDLGIVDMPIQRESHTSYPKIEGSSLKGSIREAFEQSGVDEIKIHQVFGFDETNASEEAKKIFKDNKDKFAGALGFSDARILLFPVKSVKGVFAYVTCPDVIKRFKKDLEICKEKVNFEIPNENTITNNSKVKVNDDNVILEEYTFEVEEDENTNELSKFLSQKLGVKEIEEKLVILSDDDFRDFVNMFTEVITRTKIDNNTGTVKEGALFTEEYLPAETIMYSLALVSPIMAPIEDSENEDENSVLNFFEENCPEVLQIGGNATIGKGISQIIINKGENNGKEED